MGYARNVGRVGALAVALGIGAAVATTPGVAWADDTASTSSGGTAGTVGATGTSGPSESEGMSPPGTSPAPTGPSTAAGIEEGSAAPVSGSVDASDSSTSASTGALVRQVPPGTVNATGGEHSSKESSEGVSAKGDVVAELTTDDTPPPKR